LSEASALVKRRIVWEAHRCPRCRRKWAVEAAEGRIGNPILHMCPLCQDEIRCAHKAEHPSDCYCNFTPRIA
jgi:hypothetical protein